jgi:hypothetical protein
VQQRLLAAARSVGMPVIYSKHVFRPESGLPFADPGHNFSIANAKSEIPVQVVQSGDLLIEKQTPSCFVFTNLPLILNNLGVDSLLVCGNSTSGCVRATCVDGVAHGFKMQVIEGSGIRPDRDVACLCAVRPTVQVLRRDLRRSSDGSDHGRPGSRMRFRRWCTGGALLPAARSAPRNGRCAPPRTLHRKK